MAFTKNPVSWWGSGLTLASHVLGFQTSTASSNKTLPQLTDTDANVSTGDVRIINFALCEAMFQSWVAQAGSQPTKMTIRRVVSTDALANVRYSYIMDFILTPGVPSTIASE